MPENRLLDSRLPAKGAYRPEAATYRYRNGARGRARPRLLTVDFGLLRHAPNDRILDVGCGTGRHVVEACRRPCCVVGVDCDPDELRFCKGYLYCLICDGEMRAKANLLLGDGDRLPFADGSFDRVICTEVLEHVPDDARVVRELARVLRPGGTMAVSVPAYAAETLYWRLLSLRGLSMEEHVRVYSGRRLSALLKGEGLLPFARRRRHSLESLYWLLAFALGEGAPESRISSAWEDFVERKTQEDSRALRFVERIGDRVLPKSLVIYASKPQIGRDASAREGRAAR